ncbi:RNA-directed DNA polymerase (Reverse transcriptase), partial [Trifolium medium]|nr:RNA-directed DNA polymerase (Reverse transcriptase) [Trifolium medium]
MQLRRLVGLWGEPSQWALARDVSDHCPIILRYSSQLWGPKPFKFNNFWLDHQGFKEKLKRLRGDLKTWNHEAFGNLDHNIAHVIEAIKELDLKAESGPLTQVENDARSKGFSDLWGLLKCRDSRLFQRSRSRWLKEGDANTGFFHASVKRRGRCNSILALHVGD